MKGFFPPKQVKGGNQTEQPECVIPVQMGDKDMVDLAQAEPEAAELHLCTLPAIDQKKPLIRIQQMSSRKSI
jgi:hypothetical protein